MKRIFISYRRTDSSTITGRIYDRLVAAFGEARVFKDVDDIPLGQDFRKTLEDEVSKCDILLVIIGKQWANVADESGNRRLKDPNDFVSIEVAVGLNRPNVLVVPCLVNGATLPTAEELPPDLQALRFRNAAIIRDDPDFSRDMNRLIEQIKKVNLPKPPPSPRPPRANTGFVSKWLLGGLVVLTLFFIAAIVFFASQSTLLSQVEVTASAQPRVLATAIPTPTLSLEPEEEVIPTNDSDGSLPRLNGECRYEQDGSGNVRVEGDWNAPVPEQWGAVFEVYAGNTRLYGLGRALSPTDTNATQGDNGVAQTVTHVTLYLISENGPITSPISCGEPEATNTPLPLEQAATARENARVWSTPDVKTAQVVTTLPSGTAVILVGDPVKGPIRLDTDDQGDWYQVRLPEQSVTLGWIWVDRVIITGS